MRKRIGNIAFSAGKDKENSSSLNPSVLLRLGGGTVFEQKHKTTNISLELIAARKKSTSWLSLILLGFFVFGQGQVYAQQPSSDSDLALYKDAIELIDKEKYGAAQTQLELFIKQSAHSYDKVARNNQLAEARFYHAFASFNLLHSNTQGLFEEFIRDYPNHPKVDESRFYIGKLYFMRKDYDRALPHLKKIDSGNLKREQVTQARFMMGYCYYNQGKEREAMNMFRQVRNADGQYGQMATYYYAVMSYNSGNYGEALKAFAAIKSDNKEAKDLEVFKASCLLKLKRYDELNQLADRLGKSNSKSVSNQVWFVLGNAAYDNGEYKKTVEYFKKFEGSRGGSLNREGQYRMGFSFYQGRDYAQARPRFEKCLRPEDALAQNAYYYLAQCFLKIRNFENSRTAFFIEAQLEKNSEIREEALFMYAKVSFQTNYFEDAMSSLQKMTGDFPGSDHMEEATGLIGQILLYTNNFKDAIEYLENEDGLKSKRSRSSYQRACYLYGLQLMEQQNYDVAADYLKKAYNQNLDPATTRSAYFWHAECLFRMGENQSAITAYEAFIRQPYSSKHEKYSLAYYGKGWSYLKQKKYDAAGKSFEKFIGLADKKKDSELYVDALLRAGDCEFATKNYTGALRYYKQVKDFNNKFVDYALYQMGLLYFRKENYKKAAEAHVRLASNYRKSEYRDDALITAAETYLTWLNDWSNSAKYCRVLIRDHKDSPFVPSALARLAISEERSGNKDLAIKYYKQVVYDHCKSTVNVTVAMSGLSNLLRASEYDKVEARYREQCPNSGGGGNAEMENLAIEVADTRFFEDNFSSAKDKYTNYLNDYPKGENLYHAHFYRGESFKALNNSAGALSDYEFVYKASTANEYTIKSLKSAADMLYEQGEFLASMELYTAMEEKSDKLVDRLGAQFGKAQVHLANQDFSSAKTEFLAIYSDPNTTDYSRTKARVQIAVCEYNLGSRDDAFKIFSEIEQEHDNVFGAESQYYITSILYDQGEYDQSKIAAIYLKDHYPGYNYWKAKAYLVLAEVYISLGDTFQATKGTLESLANQEAYQDVKEAAQSRLDEIEAAGGNNDLREAPQEDFDDVDEMIEEEN